MALKAYQRSRLAGIRHQTTEEQTGCDGSTPLAIPGEPAWNQEGPPGNLSAGEGWSGSETSRTCQSKRNGIGSRLPTK
jgi:hypothetical protein